MKTILILLSICTVAFLGMNNASAQTQSLEAARILRIVGKNSVIKAALKEARPRGATCKAEVVSSTLEYGSTNFVVEYSCHSESGDGMVKVKGWIYDNENLHELDLEIRFAG